MINIKTNHSTLEGFHFVRNIINHNSHQKIKRFSTQINVNATYKNGGIKKNTEFKNYQYLY